MPPARASSCPSGAAVQGPKCHPQGHASHVAASLPLGSPANTFSCLCFQAVEIGIGNFAVVPTHATVAEGKVLPIERPMFILNKPVKMFYSLESEEAKIPGKRMGSFPCSGLTIWLGASTSNTKTLLTCKVLSVGTDVVVHHPAPP